MYDLADGGPWGSALTRRSAGTNKKTAAGRADPPLLAHTPAFSSRQTVFGKQPTILGTQKLAHGHHAHAHLAHHHGGAATLHAAFLLAVFCRSWAHHTAFAAECQPFLHVFVSFCIFSKKPTVLVGVFVPSAISQIVSCQNHKMVYNERNQATIGKG